MPANLAGGTTARGALTATTQIHRVNTVGGIAPATGCAEATDVGKRVFVPYAAGYIFYSKPAQAAQ